MARLHDDTIVFAGFPYALWPRWSQASDRSSASFLKSYIGFRFSSKTLISRAWRRSAY